MENNRSNRNNKFKLLQWWEKGIVQKVSRISYDVVWNIILFFLIISLIGLFFAGGIGAGYFASLVKDEQIRSYDEMEKNIYNYEETTEIYFDNNIYLGDLRSDLYREEIKLEDVSKHVINALTATEDEYFDEHNGVVPKAIMRALFQEVTNSTVKSGGSTLTQQLIKNQILTNEVSFERKAKEILLALRLERFFNKDQILEAYLNVSTFGRNASGQNIAGIQTAAKGVFGVDAKNLNLPQAAFLAGLPQSPSYYTPFTNSGELKSEIGLEPGLKRMKTVLQRMLDNGKIDQAEYQNALSYDIINDFIEPQPTPIKQYPWLTFEIEKRVVEIMSKELAEQDGYTEEDLENNNSLKEQYRILADRELRRNGYKIHTTIDKEIYDKFQEIKDSYEDYGPDKKQTVINSETGEEEVIMEPVQVGTMLIENKTGKIISFIGGRNYQKEQLNHATDAKRPNGSTMKPLLVYAPAIEEGMIQPGSIIADTYFERKINGQVWDPDNYTFSFHGLVSARYALAKSYNIPAIKTYEKIIDVNPVEKYLHPMGFSTLTKGDESYLSMAIGSSDNGVTIEENINAFSTFGNNGNFIDAYIIEKIETKSGETIFQHEIKPVEVFSPQTSYLTIDMMRDVLKSGTATYTQYILDHKDVDWAGKTGTSNQWQDTWFVATNPNVTFGSWMGYDTPKSLKCTTCNLGYSNQNVNLWSLLVNAASEIRPELMIPKESFSRPGGLVRSSFCAASGKLPSEVCQELGLIQSDLYYAPLAPSEEDDSLIKEQYVVLNSKVYPALDVTPTEFTLEGYIFSSEYMKEKGYDEIEDKSQLIPNNDKWSMVKVPEIEPLENDGGTPSPPTSLKVIDGVLTWTASPENDVIGYRVYRSDKPNEEFKLVGNTIETEYILQNKNSVYHVKSVDFFGEMSNASITATFGEIIDEEDSQEDNNDSEFPDPINDGDNDNKDESDSNTEDGTNSGDNNEDDSNPDQGNDNIDSQPNDSQEDDDSIPDPLNNVS